MIFTTEYKHSYKGSFNFVWAYIEEDEKGNLIGYNLKELLTNTVLQKRLKMRVRNTIALVDVARDLLLPDIISSEVDNDEIVYFQGDRKLQHLVDKEMVESVKKQIISISNEWLEEEFDTLVFEALNCIKMIEDRQFIYKIDSSSDVELIKAVEKYNSNSQGSFIDYTKSKMEVPYTISNKATDEVGFRLPRIVYSTNEEEMKAYVDEAVKRVYQAAYNFQPYGSNINEINYLNYKDLGLTQEQLFGYEHNNSLGLQENEERFYGDLIALIDYNTEEYCKMHNLDLEYTRNNCIFKKTPLEELLKTIIRLMVNINWSQSKYVPNNEFTIIKALGGVSDNDDNDEAEAPITDGVSFMYDVNDLTASVSDVAINYYNKIIDFVMSNNTSIYALAELIIKLARWGERKPSRITLNFPMSKSIDRYELDPFTFEKRISEARIVTTKTRGMYNLEGVIRSRLPDFNIDGTDEDFNQLGVEPFTEVKDIIVGVTLTQPYTIGDEDRIRLVAMDLTTLIRQADKVIGLEKDENGILRISNKDNLASSLEELEGIVNNNITTLGEARNYINSKDKSIRIFINDNSMYLKHNKDLTLDNLNMLHLMDYLTILTKIQNVNAIVNPKTDMMRVFKLQSKMYLNYINNNSMMYGLEDYEPNLNDALELFQENYIGELEPVKNVSNAEEGHTDLFDGGQKKNVKPVYIFQIDKNTTYLVTSDVNQEQKSLGCKMKIFKYDPETMTVDTSSTKVQMKGYRAFRNIVVILKDEEYKQGIYVEYEEKHLMMEVVEKFLKTRDLVKAEEMLTIHINRQAQKNKNKEVSR